MTLTAVRIPDAAYDAIMLSFPASILPTVGDLNVQHVLLWPDPYQPDVAFALIRGTETIL